MNPDIQNPNQNPQPIQPGQVASPQNGPQIPDSMIDHGPVSQYPNPSDDNKTKKILIGLGILVGVFVLVVVAALILASGGNGNQEQQAEEVVNQDFVREPTSIDVENAKNSISDDVSNLSADNDFPSDNFKDENLGL